MIVVEEGVFDRHEAAHAINLFDMHQKYADVVPLSEVLEYLSAWRARQAWESTRKRQMKWCKKGRSSWPKSSTLPSHSEP